MYKHIKICHIANTDYTLKFLILNQLLFLKSKGYDVWAICSPGEFVDEIRKKGIKVKTIKLKRKISPFSDIITFIRYFIFLKKEKFKIVHTHSPKASFLGQISAKLAGIKITIRTLHGFYFHQNSNFLEKLIYGIFEKITCFCSSCILSQNKEDIINAIKYKICNPNKILYLGNGINVLRFNPNRFSKIFIQKKKQELSIPVDYKVIGIVGRLVKEKGYFDLFSAFKILLNQFPKLILLIVGPKEPEKKDGFDISVIKKYGILNNVRYLGTRTDIDEIYSLMDIFVLPSYREGFPKSILEASAMKIPVIATNIRGTKEAVICGKTGILVPIKSPEKLAEAILELLRNPEKAKKLGEQGRKEVLRNFDERFILQKIINVYDKFIKN